MEGIGGNERWKDESGEDRGQRNSLGEKKGREGTGREGRLKQHT